MQSVHHRLQAQKAAKGTRSAAGGNGRVPDSNSTENFFQGIRKTMVENSSQGVKLSPSNTSSSDEGPNNTAMSLAAALKMKGKLREARTKVHSKRMIILPGNGLKTKWDLLIGALIMYSVIIIPLNIGFDLSYPYTHPSFIFDCVIDVLFLIDMITAFNTAYVDSRTQQVVTDRKRIASSYLLSWFSIDFFSTVPIDLIAKQLMGPDGGNSVRSIKLIRVMRLVRLLKLVRLFKLSKFMNSLDASWIKPAAMRLLKLLLQILLIAHLLACFWHLLCTMDPENPDNWNKRHGYLTEIDCTREHEHPPEMTYCEPEQTGFVSVLVPVAQSSVGDQYLASMYWVIASMMAVGYGDIFAVTNEERVYSILAQVVGACCFGFIIAYVTMLMESINPAQKAHSQRMGKLKEYIAERNLSCPLARKLKKQLEHYLQATSVFEGDRILNELPQELRTRLVHSIYRDMIERLEIFKNCEDGSVVADIMQVLLPMVAAPHTQFYAEGDVPLDMYFVAKGKAHASIMLPITDKQKHHKEMEMQHDVEMLSAQDDMKHKHSLMPHLAAKKADTDATVDPMDPKEISLQLQEVAIGVVEAGHSFGESELLRNCCREYGVSASQHSDLFVLTKSQFEELLFVHDEIARDIAAKSKKQEIAFAKVVESETMERLAEDGFHHHSVKSFMLVNGQLRRQEKITNRLFRRQSTVVVTQSARGNAQNPAEKNPVVVSDRSASQNDLSSSLSGDKIGGKGNEGACILCLRAKKEVMREIQQEHRKGNVHPAMMPQSPTDGSTRVNKFESDQHQETLKAAPTPSSLNHAPEESAADTIAVEQKSSSPRHSRLEEARPAPVNMPAPVSSPKSGSKRLSLNFGRPHAGTDKVTSPVPNSPTVDLGCLVGNDRGALSCVGKDDEDAHKYIVMEETTSSMLQQHYIINPDDDRKKMWDLWIGFIIVYSVIVIPFRLSFGVEPVGVGMAVDIIFDVFFFLDMFASFRTAYWHSYDSDVLVCVPSAIYSKYLKGWFLVDFPSTVPIDRIFELILTPSQTSEGEAQGSDGSVRVLKLIRVVRLVRLLKLIRLMKLGKNMGHLEEVLHISDGVIRLTSLVANLIFMAHLFGCFWFFITGDKTENLEAQDGNTPWWKSVKVGNDVWSQYFASLYWAFTTMTTVGYGDIVPTNTGERVYAIIIMILGATVFGYIVGSVATLVTAENASNKKEELWNQASEWIEEKNIAKILKTRIRTHYDWMWQTQSVFDEQGILSCMPSVLRNEVINEIHHEFLVKIAIFKPSKFRSDIGFTASILSVMKPEFCPAGEYIIFPHRTAKCMHFLLSGIAELFEDDLDGEVVKEVLEVGSFFGHEALLSHSKHALGVRAFVACKTYALTKVDIGGIVESHPAIAAKLQDALAVSIKTQHNRLQRKRLIGIGVGPKKSTNQCSKPQANSSQQEKNLETVLGNVSLLSDRFRSSNLGAVVSKMKAERVIGNEAPTDNKPSMTESASMPSQ